MTSCRPSRRTSFPSLGGAFALLFDPGRAVHIKPLRCGGAALVGTTTKAPTTGIFEAPSHSFSTAAGTVRSMVGFAVPVTQTPRKTRFRLLAKLYREGIQYPQDSTERFRLL